MKNSKKKTKKELKIILGRSRPKLGAKIKNKKKKNKKRRDKHGGGAKIIKIFWACWAFKTPRDFKKMACFGRNFGENRRWSYLTFTRYKMKIHIYILWDKSYFWLGVDI